MRNETTSAEHCGLDARLDCLLTMEHGTCRKALSLLLLMEQLQSFDLLLLSLLEECCRLACLHQHGDQASMEDWKAGHKTVAGQQTWIWDALMASPAWLHALALEPRNSVMRPGASELVVRAEQQHRSLRHQWRSLRGMDDCCPASCHQHVVPFSCTSSHASEGQGRDSWQDLNHPHNRGGTSAATLFQAVL